jgi:hypothetical protein
MFSSIGDDRLRGKRIHAQLSSRQFQFWRASSSVVAPAGRRIRSRDWAGSNVLGIRVDEHVGTKEKPVFKAQMLACVALPTSIPASPTDANNPKILFTQ